MMRGGRCLLLALGLVAVSLVSAANERHAHWVIRSSHLEKTLEFTTDVLGMKILRHEENDEPCEITCNGQFESAWSKTMVGYDTEDKAYALEITYNYAVDKYVTGTGLRAIGVQVKNFARALERAEAFGYTVRDINGAEAVIIGPDGYKYHVSARDEGRGEQFTHVELLVKDAAVARDWYVRVLGMRDLGETPGGNGRIVGYDDATQVPMHLVESRPRRPRIEQWEGRHALSIPAADLQRIYKKISEERPDLIVHEIMELHEKLGTLFIAIIKDVDGFEICLVSSETFDKAVAAADDFKGPDWELRKKLFKMRGKIDPGRHESIPSWVDYMPRVFYALMNPAEMRQLEAEFFACGFFIGFVTTAVSAYYYLEAEEKMNYY